MDFRQGSACRPLRHLWRTVLRRTLLRRQFQRPSVGAIHLGACPARRPRNSHRRIPSVRADPTDETPSRLPPRAQGCHPLPPGRRELHPERRAGQLRPVLRPSAWPLGLRPARVPAHRRCAMQNEAAPCLGRDADRTRTLITRSSLDPTSDDIRCDGREIRSLERSRHRVTWFRVARVGTGRPADNPCAGAWLAARQHLAGNGNRAVRRGVTAGEPAGPSRW